MSAREVIAPTQLTTHQARYRAPGGEARSAAGPVRWELQHVLGYSVEAGRLVVKAKDRHLGARHPSPARLPHHQHQHQHPHQQTREGRGRSAPTHHSGRRRRPPPPAWRDLPLGLAARFPPLTRVLLRWLGGQAVVVKAVCNNCHAGGGLGC